MATTISLSELLSDRVTKLKELKLAGTLVRHRNAFSEQLSEIETEIDSMKSEINVMKNDHETMKAQNTHCLNSLLLLRHLEAEFTRMEEFPCAECIEEFGHLKEETSPPVTNFSRESSAMSEESTVGRNWNQIDDINASRQKIDLQNCKKVLFKNAEDSYSLDRLSDEEFSKIPKYMIGRQSLTSINDLVTTINAILKAKYELLALGKNGARKKGKLDLYLSLKKDEIVVSSGEDPIYFFTAEDYHRHTQSKLDKVKLNLLTVLRHCKRLRELRIGKNIHYVVISA